MREPENELIVVVDEHDTVIGESEKDRCHNGKGILHRGFLAMVFDGSGSLLLTKRSKTKRLWPGYWDGSVASHVHRGEDYVQAARRRIAQELGTAAGNIEYGFKFHYRAEYGDAGTEHEICAVTIVRGINRDEVLAAPEEISEIRTTDLKALIEQVREDSRGYTPWLILALAHISERPVPAQHADVQKVPC